jgi:uncharacterized membrane protein (UPF0127 family)
VARNSENPASWLKEGDGGGAPAEIPLKAINVSKGGVIIAEQIEWAGTGARRRKGLSGRKAMDCMEGIYLTPCEWIHTFGMHFPIDVAFLSSTGKILAIHHSLKPNRFSKIVLRADGVLELCAGRLCTTATEVGDTIQLIEMDDTSGRSGQG